MGRKFGLEVLLAAMCFIIVSCSANPGTMQTSSSSTAQSSTLYIPQPGDITSAEVIQTEEETVNTKPSEVSEQAQTEMYSEADTVGEAIGNQEKSYTFEEISESLDQQEIQWEAYYNVSGERIDMYLQDGTALLFLSNGEFPELDQMILVMQDDQFYKLGFQEAYEIDLVQAADQEYYPQTAEYYLSDTELMAMNQTDLKIALHEIYARHGKWISEPFLKAVFGQKTWYLPEYAEEDFADKQDTLLNRYEKENIKSIAAIQKKRGFADDLAVDYQVPRSIVSGSCIDLDGDGTGERLVFDFIYAGPYEIVQEYMVMINPKVPGDFKILGTIDKMPPAVYTASLDGKTRQLIMSGRMKDGKPRTDIYNYEDGEAALAGQIDADNLEIMNNWFWAYQYDEQQIRLERAQYIYVNGTVIDTGVTQAVNGNHDNRISTLIDNLDFNRSRIAYSEMAAELERIGVSWESALNSSGERMDIVCDDGTELILMETGLAEKELVMAGERFSEKGFKRFFIQEQTAEPGEFYYPQTAERLLRGYELDVMNQTELSIARNEIYARYGRCFMDPFLHAVFSRKSWYQPKYSGSELDGEVDPLFNNFEKENITLLVEAERALEVR